MEIKITTRQILRVLLVIAYIIFVGVCIDAAGIISNAFITLVINPSLASNFWNKIDLSGLYNYDRGYFIVETFLMSIVAIMKAMIFLLIIRILHNKRVAIAQPFNQEVCNFIMTISYLALGIGFFSQMGVKYAEWFVKEGVKMPDIHYLHIGGPDVWLFMGVALLIVAQIFKRGIEIQKENELTV